MEALMELQALRLPRAVGLCKTSTEQSLGGGVHGALHGALGQYFNVLNHKPKEEGSSCRPL